jgi:uncharacterized protein involved in exopolysaccharide biosynthesis
VSNYTNEEGIINVSAVIASIRQRLLFIALSTLAVSIATFGWMLSLPDQYRAEVHLISTNNDDQLSFGGVGGDLGGIASLAGFDSRLGGKSRLDRLSLDVIQTQSFAADFLSNQSELLPLLIAVQSWDAESSSLQFDDALYTAENGWVGEPITETKQLERLWSAVYQFEKRLEVTESSATNMVTLAFEHESPDVAVDVLESLQLKINSQMRDSVIEDSKRNIEYLTVEANNTSVADLKAVFYRLIEEQTKTLMLASSSREFVFKKATPILMPVSPSGPPRLLITIIMGFMTFLLGCLVAVIVGPRNAAE